MSLTQNWSFLTVLAFLVWAACSANESGADGVEVRTFAYKQVGDLAIKADVHRRTDMTPQPVVVWIHGGALINGGRQGGGGQATQRFLDEGYTLVSIDYRLAPETKLPQIMADVEDAFRWIRMEGPTLFGADPGRIAVMGSSAGGYLTLASGFRVEPAPRVLVAFWGYGDLVGEWYSEPSQHARHRSKTMTAEEASDLSAGPPVANARDRAGDGGAFYQYCRQKGLWPFLVAGFDPHTEPEKFAPYMPVENVDSDYPPTLLIHGTDDTDVPYDQSLLMAEQFEKSGVPYDLYTVEGAEHGLAGADRAERDRANEAAFRFVAKYINR